jgi:hypothetical protein
MRRDRRRGDSRVEIHIGIRQARDGVHAPRRMFASRIERRHPEATGAVEQTLQVREDLMFREKRIFSGFGTTKSPGSGASSGAMSESVPKQRWNSFHQTNLDLQLRVRGIETIVIAGGSTDVGIASTVFSARDLDYGIVVVKDACYSARGSNNEFFMERVFPRMARIRSVDETIALMTK